jgi:hypothetical protein
MYRHLLVFACAVFLLIGATSASLMADASQKLPPGMTPAMFKMMMTPGPPHPAGLPPDVKPYLGCIPTMGYHYARPQDWPFGPIYGWYKGKPTFTEVMIDANMFKGGKSWDEVLKPLPGYKIDHVDIWYEAYGHPGYKIPHYDIHAWYIPRSEYMYFCNNTSGKKPVFL